MADETTETTETIDARGLRQGAGDPATAEAIRWRIIETAERLFRQFGYQKTTVADIAAALGMSPANIYRFFASKAAITEAVIWKATAEIADVGRAAANDRSLPATERLRRMMMACYTAISQRCIADNRLHEVVHVAINENWEVINHHKKTMLGIAADIIADGVARGEFDVQDVQLAARLWQCSMMCFFHPVLIEHRLRNGEDIDATIEPMLAFAFRGLGASETV
jgi:AcrR family transcriptional regulator